MRTHQDRPGDSSESRSESPNTSSQQSTSRGELDRQSGARSDAERPLPATSELGTRAQQRRGWLSPFGTAAMSPWELMRNMSEEIDRLIEGLGGRSTGYSLTSQRGRGGTQGGTFMPVAWMPQIETIQKRDALVLRAELPGLNPEDVNVSVEDGLLTLSGERKQEHEEKRDGFMRTERSYGTFYRAIALPEGADEEKIKGSFKNGVLEITVPLSERERGRRIKVDS